MNREQGQVEFEFLDFPPDDRLIPKLYGDMVPRREIRAELPEFAQRMTDWLARQCQTLDLTEKATPDRYVILCFCQFDDNYYSVRNKASVSPSA
jgi:hypothetical protein